MVSRDDPWPDGTPIWVDLATGDLAGAHAFYRAVFGWDVRAVGRAYGSYAMGLLRGRPVAGIGASPAGRRVPPAWITYLATQDVQALRIAARALGGSVLGGCTDVGRLGRSTILADPTGATFGLWQVDYHIGAQVVNEPGALVWNECVTTDPPRARQFYTALLHYRYAPVEQALDYTLIARRGADPVPAGGIGGICGLDPWTAAGPDPHWLTYFGADDVDLAAARIRWAGGVVRAGPRDGCFGRTALCQDPQGAVFALLQVHPMG